VPAGVLDTYFRKVTGRERARRAKPPAMVRLSLNLAERTHSKQAAFILDESGQVVALCGRRAGKTSGARLKLIKTAAERPGTVSVLVTQTRAAAKKLYWRQLQNDLRALDVGFEYNATELIIRLPNGSEIWLAGAANATDIERLRGYAFALVIIDEAQAIRDDVLQRLVEDVLQWALVDHQGQLVLIGTPPPVPVGWFVERYTKVDAKGRPILGWSDHHFTIFDNTKMPGGQKAVVAYLDKIRRERGIVEGSPTYRREVLGELVLDASQLVLNAFDLDLSVYWPNELPATGATTVLGVDIGYQDADAIAALTRFPVSNDLWLAEEWEENHQTEEQLGAKILEFNTRHHPIAKVADTGGGGRKTVAGISQRLGLEIEAAHKPSVVEQFQRLNDEFRARGETGRSRLRVPAGGLAARDAIRLAWEPTKIGQKIAKHPHSNILPALSYAYSRMSRYLAELPEEEKQQLTPQEQAYAETIASYQRMGQS
jgi:hypothetical protein